ncbi:hypothetical protein V6Z11_D09G070000 [Gossypium hirsutum]
MSPSRTLNSYLGFFVRRPLYLNTLRISCYMVVQLHSPLTTGSFAALWWSMLCPILLTAITISLGIAITALLSTVEDLSPPLCDKTLPTLPPLLPSLAMIDLSEMKKRRRIKKSLIATIGKEFQAPEK